MTNELNIKFLSAKRTHENCIELKFSIDTTEFTVEVTNIDGATGNLGSYYIVDGGHCCSSEDESVADRVSSAINKAESDDNPDLELYLFIRDAFHSQDCELEPIINF